MMKAGEPTVIRSAEPGDYDAFTRLFAEFGIPDPVPPRERFSEMTIRVAVRNDEVVGFCSWRRYGSLVHVVQLAVDPAVRGQRIGEHLLLDIRELGLAAGCTRWYLNVKRSNTSAITLYERVGFRFELESTAFKIPWSCVPPRAVTGGLVEPVEDPTIAERFGVPLERLTLFRTRARLSLVALRDGSELVGFAAFDPDFPNASIFRTIRAELGVDLLNAMRPFALPAFDFVRATVEGDRLLGDALLALGAENSYELLRLSGPL